MYLIVYIMTWLYLTHTGLVHNFTLGLSSQLHTQAMCTMYLIVCELGHSEGNKFTLFTPSSPTARPLVSLPETATVMEGEERTLMCDITGFYPENLAVTWLIQNVSRVARGSMARGAISRDVCTGMAVPNPDGTYSVSSHITVQASAVGSGGAMYICHIEHRSYPDGKYSKSILLTVQGVKPTHHSISFILGFITNYTVFSPWENLICGSEHK